MEQVAPVKIGKFGQEPGTGRVVSSHVHDALADIGRIAQGAFRRRAAQQAKVPVGCQLRRVCDQLLDDLGNPAGSRADIAAIDADGDDGTPVWADSAGSG
ncbi:hypothetical protein MACH05_23510 [Qipengyuania nanhaisediminis]